MENNKYPFFHKLFTAKQTKRKSQNRNDKTCKRFCKNIFLPERERVEMEFAKKYKMKYRKIPQTAPLLNFLFFSVRFIRETMCNKVGFIGAKTNSRS
jgi:hypothetical protein